MHVPNQKVSFFSFDLVLAATGVKDCVLRVHKDSPGIGNGGLTQIFQCIMHGFLVDCHK